jgi:hypothetical protein
MLLRREKRVVKRKREREGESGQEREKEIFTDQNLHFISLLFQEEPLFLEVI